MRNSGGVGRHLFQRFQASNPLLKKEPTLKIEWSLLKTSDGAPLFFTPKSDVWKRAGLKEETPFNPSVISTHKAIP